MQTSSFKEIAKQLTGTRPPRAWSLLVTVFGELAQEERARISGLLLRTLSAQMGIKPEAMRVALHRLRKDGWIESARTGRTSDYFLTPWGRTQSSGASPRIYAPGPAAKDAWLVLTNPGQLGQIKDDGAAWISSSMRITASAPETSDAFATQLLASQPLPPWMANKVCPAETTALSKDFATTLAEVTKTLGQAPQLNAIEIAALRVLLVHSWRRIILKAPILPDHVFPANWAGPDCRSRVFHLLNRFPKQDLSVLEEALLSHSPR